MRTREVFRHWGVEDRFLAEGTLPRKLELQTPTSRTLVTVDFSALDCEVDQPGVLFLEQARTEKLLLDAVRETGLCDVCFGNEAVTLEQAENTVRLKCREGSSEHTIEADFVVGCDGANSFTREALGLPFEGFTYWMRAVLADVRIRDERDKLPWPRLWNGTGGLTVAVHLPDGLWRLMHLARGEPDADETVPDPEIEKYVNQALGDGPFDVEWKSRFRIHLRSAPTYRVGRVLLAGDAAHIHSPAGGLGMNAGIQDAHNLAWKLAAAMDDGDEESLLASYDIERRPVTAEDVSQHADYITKGFLQAPAALRAPAFLLIRLLLAIRPIRRQILRRMTMIGLSYDQSPLLRSGARAVGNRLPNPLLRCPDGTETRLYDIAPNAAFLVHIADEATVDLCVPVQHVIRIGAGAYLDPADLLRSTIGGNGWILVRPDLYIAWTGESKDELARTAHEALGLAKRNDDASP